MDEYVTTAKAKKMLGVHEDTLRRWADQGMFPSIRSPGGTRLYNVNKYLNKEQIQDANGKEGICYCRVSSQGQKDDLQRQIQYMQEKFPNHRIISDIGSGINFKRRGFRSIIELATKGRVQQVVVAYRDRLCRFAFELVSWFFQIHQVELVVLNKEVDSTEEKEMAEDILAIINVFNCRVNGKRKYKNKKSESQVAIKQINTGGVATIT
jgi:predicted site-specific integrase-resolvase